MKRAIFLGIYFIGQIKKNEHEKRTYNMTLRNIHETTVVVEKISTYFCGCSAHGCVRVRVYAYVCDCTDAGVCLRP